MNEFQPRRMTVSGPVTRHVSFLLQRMCSAFMDVCVSVEEQCLVIVSSGLISLTCRFTAVDRLITLLLAYSVQEIIQKYPLAAQKWRRSLRNEMCWDFLFLILTGVIL